MIEVWIDGSSTGRKGEGGAACIILYEDEVHIQTQCFSQTELVGNNHMELYALLIAIRNLPNASDVRIYTDSNNVIQWITGGWKRNDPRISIYADEIEKLILEKNLTIEYVHISGHSGIPLNEQADILAKQAKERQESLNQRLPR